MGRSLVLAQMLPELLSEAGRDHHNLFIRPYCRGTSLIQLDDLTDERAAELIPMCFLTLKTSTAKSQAWIAIPASGDAEGDKDLRRRVKKAVRSDPMASGSVRVAGSRNFKPDYAPGRTGEKEFPVVTITHAAPGRITTREALEGQGLVVPAPPGPFYASPRERAEKRAVARLSALPGQRAAADGRHGQGPEPCGLHLVQACDGAIPAQRGGDSRRADASEREGAREGRGLRQGDRPRRRPSARE